MDYYIYSGGKLINTIVSDVDFVKNYCAENGYTFEAVDPPPEPEPEPEPEPTIDERVAALETEKANQTDVDELNEALNMILTGVTE